MTAEQKFITSCALGEEFKIEDLLKSQSIDPNCQDAKGYTPLHISLGNGQIGVVMVLLNYGANPNVLNKDGQNALHIAASLGVKDCIPLLLEKGAELEKRDKNGNTPLSLACESSVPTSEDVAIMLVQKGADIKTTNNSKKTTGMLAAKTGKTRLLDLLIEKGLDLSLKDQLGLTVQDYKSS